MEDSCPVSALGLRDAVCVLSGVDREDALGRRYIRYIGRKFGEALPSRMDTYARRK